MRPEGYICEIKKNHTRHNHNDEQTGTVAPADPNTANKHTGYLVGGTSPFGTLKKLPVCAEASIFSLEKMYINGGKRGFLVKINPNDIRKALELTEVNIAVQSESSVRQFPITSN